MEEEKREGETPVKATHLQVISGGKEEVPVQISAGEVEKLFREHHDRVFRVAYRVTGSLVDAEDVLQTVFLRLSRRQEVNLEPNPGSYLHRAAVNASLDLLRRRGRSQIVSIDEVEGALPGDKALNPESRRANQELRGAIRGAISHLGEKTAEMFVLKYFEGYGNQEIAEMMGTSAMVVGVLLHRARTRVKKELGEYLEGAV